MSPTFSMAPHQPLLLPVLSTEPPRSADHRQSDGSLSEAHLYHALIERIAQPHPMVIAEPVAMDDLGACLERCVRQSMTQILILPWNLPAATPRLVQQAMNALHRTGAETVSASSLLLTHPVTVPGVSPAGPLGGLLPPHPWLDRFVEQWPCWQHVYTVVRSEQAAMLVVHTGTSQPQPPENVPLHRLKQALCTTFCHEQKTQKPAANDSMGQRDSAIYAWYLSGMVTSALDALCSLPRDQQE